MPRKRGQSRFPAGVETQKEFRFDDDDAVLEYGFDDLPDGLEEEELDQSNGKPKELQDETVKKIAQLKRPRLTELTRERIQQTRRFIRCWAPEFMRVADISDPAELRLNNPRGNLTIAGVYKDKNKGFSWWRFIDTVLNMLIPEIKRSKISYGDIILKEIIIPALNGEELPTPLDAEELNEQISGRYKKIEANLRKKRKR